MKTIKTQKSAVPSQSVGANLFARFLPQPANAQLRVNLSHPQPVRMNSHLRNPSFNPFALSLSKGERIKNIAQPRVNKFAPTALMLALTAAGFFALPPQPAHAAPQGGQVVAGQATIAQPNANTTTITQSSQKAIIDWQSFSIAANQHTQFIQPSAASVTLNRVVGVDPSQILGRLTANGQVFLVNPNGIYFGKNAQIDVAGLIATTHNIRNADFLAGNYTFNIAGKAGAAVINDGMIHINDTGIAAFVAPSVANRGVITARLGKIMLASANGFTLDFSGDQLISFLVNDQVAQTAFDLQGNPLTSFVENAGQIQAQGGYVLLTAKAAENAIHSVINQTGSIEATTVGTHNGTIILNAGTGSLNVAGTLDASALPPTAELPSPAGGRGVGGEGNGGFIETSGAHVKIDPNAKITTAAPFGKAGTWLIDPVDFIIAAIGGDMTGAQLSAALDLNNVIIQSISGLTVGNGDIFINDAITKALGTAATSLSLVAVRNINVNAPITSTAGALTINFTAGVGGTNNILANISTNGGAINLTQNTVVSGGITLSGAGGVMNLGATTTLMNVLFDNLTVNNTGTITQTGDVMLNNGATINNSGVYDFNVGYNCGWLCTNGGILSGNAGVGTFNNTGTLRQTSAFGAWISDGVPSFGVGTFVFNNTAGILDAVGAPISINTSTSNFSSGTIQGLGVGLHGGANNFSGTIGGTGSLTLNNTIAVNAATGTTINVPVNMPSGALTVSGALTLAGGANLTGNVTGKNAGAVDSINISGATTLLNALFDNLTVNNTGTITQTGDVMLNNGATINNSGVYDFNVGYNCGWLCTNGGILSGNAGVGTFNNTGTLRQTSAFGAWISDGVPSFGVGTFVFNNTAGILDAVGAPISINTSASNFSSGTIQGLGVGLYGGTNTFSGAINIATGSTLTLNGGTYAFDSGAITGAGTLSVAGTINASGGAMNIGKFILQTGGTWHQVMNPLPSFVAQDFQLLGGAFIRAVAGDGSIAKPYQLADIYGVQGIASTGMNGNSYLLASNIDATPSINWNAGAGFTPIGNITTFFTGTFDGLGHTINNLTINLPASNYVGLFGLTLGSTIQNVGLVGGSVNGQLAVGMLVGENNGIINNSYATGNATGLGTVGGLVGGAGTGAIDNSYATGNVNSTTGAADVGGLVGNNWNGGTINHSYSTGSVSAGGGGLVGLLSAGSITNSYWDITTSGQTIGIGGAGAVQTGVIGLTTAQMQQQANFTGWDFVNTWQILAGATHPTLKVFNAPVTPIAPVTPVVPPPPTTPTLTPAQALLVQQHQGDSTFALLLAISQGLFTNSSTDPVWVGLYQNGAATANQIAANAQRNIYDAYTAADIFAQIRAGTLVNNTSPTNTNWRVIYRNGQATAAQVAANAFDNTYTNYKIATAATLFNGLVTTKDISLSPTAANAVVWNALVSNNTANANRAAQMAGTYNIYKIATVQNVLTGLGKNPPDLVYGDTVWNALAAVNPNMNAAYQTNVANKLALAQAAAAKAKLAADQAKLAADQVAAAQAANRSAVVKAADTFAATTRTSAPAVNTQSSTSKNVFGKMLLADSAEATTGDGTTMPQGTHQTTTGITLDLENIPRESATPSKPKEDGDEIHTIGEFIKNNAQDGDCVLFFCHKSNFAGISYPPTQKETEKLSTFFAELMRAGDEGESLDKAIGQAQILTTSQYQESLKMFDDALSFTLTELIKDKVGDITNEKLGQGGLSKLNDLVTAIKKRDFTSVATVAGNMPSILGINFAPLAVVAKFSANFVSGFNNAEKLRMGDGMKKVLYLLSHPDVTDKLQTGPSPYKYTDFVGMFKLNP